MAWEEHNVRIVSRSLLLAVFGLIPFASPAPAAPRQQLGMAFRKSTLPGGGHPFDVAIDDLNGDGNLDLAVTNPKDNRIALYFGNGDGTFSDPSLLETAKQPRGIVAVDFNNDGHLDLAVSATGAHAVAVHDGSGDGTFSEPRLFAVGKRPFMLAAANLDGNAFTDLIVPDESGWQAWLLFGDGKGNFTARAIRAGKWSSDGAAGDFNEDGIADLAITNWGSNNVSVHLGKGGGTFAPPSFYDFQGRGHALYCVEIADLDRDGHQDMLWNDIQRTDVYVLYGDGKGNFPRRARLPAGAGVRSMTAVDLNGDGWLDVTSSNLADNELSVMLADGKGGFHPTQYVEVGTYPRVVVAGDVDRDGKPDLVVPNMRSNDVTVLLNEGPTMLTLKEKPLPTPRTAPVQIEDLKSPKGIAFDPQGQLLVADQDHHRIVRVDPTNGKLTTLAGTGQPGYGGDGGPAYAAQLRQPADVAVDEQGNVFIADTGNHRIRKIEPNGTISTVAGTGQAGFAGDGGPAAQAKINLPLAVAVGNGVLYVSDAANLRVRKIAPSGIISTVAGTGIPGKSADGRIATESRIKPVNDLAILPNHDLLIADTLNSRICKVDQAGILTTVVSAGHRAANLTSASGTENFGAPTGVTVSDDGRIFIADRTGGQILEVASDGSLQTVLPPENSHPWSPSAVALGRDSIVYFSDLGSSTIQKIAPSGVATVAGQKPVNVSRHVPNERGGAGKAQRALAPPPELAWEYGFRSGSDANAPYAVQVAEDGAIYVAGDTGTGADWQILRLSSTGEKVWGYEYDSGGVDIPYGLVRGPAGELITAGMTSGEKRDYLVVSVSPEGKQNWRYTAREKGNQAAYGVALGKDGNILLAGESGDRFEVTSLTAEGEIRWRQTDVAGSARAIDVDPDGNVLVAGYRPSFWRVVKLNVDGTPQWEHQVEGQSRGLLSAVAYGLRVDAEGNSTVTGVWSGAEGSHLRVEKLDPAGQVVWEYIDEEPFTIGRAVALRANGGAIVVGETAEDWLMLELDPSGRLLWCSTRDGGGGKKNPDQAHAVALTGDGGFIAAGVDHPVPPKFPNLGAVEWRVARYRGSGAR